MNRTSFKSSALIFVYALYFMASNTAYYCYGNNNHFEVEYLFSAECCVVELCDTSLICSDAKCNEGLHQEESDCEGCQDIPFYIDMLSSNKKDLSLLDTMRYSKIVPYTTIDFFLHGASLCSNTVTTFPPIELFKSIHVTILRL